MRGNVGPRHAPQPPFVGHAISQLWSSGEAHALCCAEYRLLAEQCKRLVSQAEDEQYRLLLIRVAARLSELADQAEVDKNPGQKSRRKAADATNGINNGKATQATNLPAQVHNVRANDEDGCWKHLQAAQFQTTLGARLIQ